MTTIVRSVHAGAAALQWLVNAYLLPLSALLLLGRAAMLMPASLAILGQSFAGEARGRAIGI